jgi:hypothetical protein
LSEESRVVPVLPASPIPQIPGFVNPTDHRGLRTHADGQVRALGEAKGRLEKAHTEWREKYPDAYQQRLDLERANIA